jgi:hypothetical protein
MQVAVAAVTKASPPMPGGTGGTFTGIASKQGNPLQL